MEAERSSDTLVSSHHTTQKTTTYILRVPGFLIEIQTQDFRNTK
jgi:hypothetical protein